MIRNKIIIILAIGTPSVIALIFGFVLWIQFDHIDGNYKKNLRILEVDSALDSIISVVDSQENIILLKEELNDDLKVVASFMSGYAKTKLDSVDYFRDKFNQLDGNLDEFRDKSEKISILYNKLNEAEIQYGNHASEKLKSAKTEKDFVNLYWIERASGILKDTVNYVQAASFPKTSNGNKNLADIEASFYNFMNKVEEFPSESEKDEADVISEFWKVAHELSVMRAEATKISGEIKNSLDNFLSDVSDVQTELTQHRMTTEAENSDALGYVNFAIISFVVFIAIWSGLVLFLFSKWLSRRCSEAMSLAHDLTDVDPSVLNSEAEEHNKSARFAAILALIKERVLAQQASANEVQQKLAEFQRIRELEMQSQSRVIHEVGNGLNRLAEGKLCETILGPTDDPFPVECEALREAYNSVVIARSETVQQISSVAEQVRAGSTEITTVAHDLSGRAETQAATLEESAAALNELTESVQSTAEWAKNAEKASHENRSIAEGGASIVRDAVAAMQEIETSSEQITRIIGVIDDIAFQTNLLALNAGVEAARAGEAGRGFAVVASEVRGLAQRASDSAREIKSLISESAVQVKIGSGLVGKTGESLEKILEHAQDVSNKISAIAAAASEQSTGLIEISAGINHLDQVTQQNAAIAEETNAVANTLQQRADDLMREISRFGAEPQIVTPDLNQPASNEGEESISNVAEISFARNHAAAAGGALYEF